MKYLLLIFLIIGCSDNHEIQTVTNIVTHEIEYVCVTKAHYPFYSLKHKRCKKKHECIEVCKKLM